GGRLGNAAFDPVDVPFGALGASVLVMTLLGGAVTTVLPVLRAPKAGPTPAEPDGGPVTAGSEIPADDLENGGDSDAQAEEEAAAPQQQDAEATHGDNSGKDTDC
ncbi:MAG: hypothetical protein ACRDSH_14185, partial [Pseudonocardiaceae bacterium]